MWTGRGAGAKAQPAIELAGARQLMRTVKGVGLQPCPADESLLCGKVQVPLDRRNPTDHRTIGISFMVAPHTGPKARAAGAVMSTSGGPGNSITGCCGEMYFFRDYMLAPFTRNHDLIFVDQRGVGLSSAINCPAWQHETPTYDRARACLLSLGDRRNVYSTAAVADDLDAVRAALGFRKLVMVGGSYAGNDVVTYAVRHREHVSKVVASSPFLPVGADQFADTTPKAIPGVVTKLCGRSTECSRANPHAYAQLRWLAARLRQHPVTGIGYDYSGQPQHVRVTESYLLWAMLQNGDFPFLEQGEITQAAAALRRGDRTPLLRLAAEMHRGPGDFDSGDPRDFSAGHNIARFCVDADFPWDEQAPAALRHHQFAAAAAAEPTFYGLFSSDGWMAGLPLGFIPDPCITVPIKSDRPYPPGSKVPGVPTLVLDGDYDLTVPTADTRRATRVMTDSTFVTVKTAGHNPWFWRGCAVTMVQRFVRIGHTTDLCAHDPVTRMWEVGSFPRSVAAAPPAARRPDDQSNLADRRLATVGVWTVLDTIHRSYPSPTQTGVGLRGGHTSVEFGDFPTPDLFTLDQVKFTNDVIVNGTGFADWDGNYGGDITLHRIGGPTMTIHFGAQWYSPDADVFPVNGRVDGRTVRLAVPAT